MLQRLPLFQRNRHEQDTFPAHNSRVKADVADILEEHFQQLIESGGHSPQVCAREENEVEELTEVAPLMKLAEELYNTVLPMQPSARFRAELRQALIATHRRRAAQRTLFPRPDREDLSPWLWRMAATVPVVLGILAYLWHRSNRSVHNAQVEVGA